MTSSRKPLTPEQLKSVVGGAQFLMAKPETLSAAAGGLNETAVAVSAANVDAVKGQGVPTTGVAPAVSDEGSAAVAAQFAALAQTHQTALAEQAAMKAAAHSIHSAPFSFANNPPDAVLEATLANVLKEASEIAAQGGAALAKLKTDK